MEYEFIMYKDDYSFDYGDFPNSTCCDVVYHGFTIDVDRDTVDISSINGYNECEDMNRIKSAGELKDYLIANYHKIDDLLYGVGVSNRMIFDNLIRLLT